MRFHHLLVENITSLRGTHIIDFDSVSKVDDLFAITGPTGSGKSSILNAIMLALYGETFKTDLKQSDLISLGEKKARIELLFSVNGKRIRSVWEGKAKGSVPRRFFDEKGEEISKDVLPLTFDQFCKTIILNQGEFARFLTSSFAERKDILEKLYGEEILAKLSPCLNALLKSKQEELNTLIDQEKNILPYSQDEIDQWQKEVENLNIEIQKEKLAKDILVVFISDLKDLLKYHQKENELTKKNIGFLEELKVFTDTFNSDQSNLSISATELLKAEQDLNNKRPLLLSLIEKEKEKELLQKELSDKQNTQRLLDQKKLQISKQVLDLKSSIEENQKRVQELQKQITVPISDLQNQQDLFLKGQKIYNELKSSQTLYKIKTEQFELSKKKKADILTQENQTREELHQLLSDALISSPQRKLELEKRKEENRNKLRLKQETGLKIINLEKKQNEQSNTLKQIEEELLKLGHGSQEDQIEKSTEGLLSKFKDYLRSQAKEQKTCPICQSTDVSHLVSAQNKMQNLREIIECNLSLQEDLIQLHKKKAQLEEKANQAKSQFENIQRELVSDQQNFNQNLNLDFSKLIQEIECEIEALEKVTRTKLTLEQKLLHITSELKSLTQDILNQEGEMTLLNQKKTDEEFFLKNIFTNANIAFSLDQLEQSFDHWNKTLSTLREIQQTTAVLSEKEKNLAQTLVNATSIDNETKQNSMTLSGVQNKIASITKDLNASLSPGQSANALLKLEESKLTELRQKKDTFNAKLQKTIQGKQNIEIQIKTNNEQKLELTLLMTKLWAKLSEGLKQHQELNLGTPEKILGPKTLAEIEDWKLLDIFLEQSLIRRLEDLDFTSQEKRQTLEGHRAKISLFEQKKELQKNLKEDLEKRKEELARWNNLHSLIGNDDFRNYTLGLIERELVIFANQELQHLCQGRFSLEQTEVKKGNDFSVMDRWKGGELRKVSTLSGGETFLVSLALSMALAEMSRGTASIESFFIDEGFGTLDQESLTEVLEALSNLKGRGKVVGLISHVKELTERIAVNISVRKNTTGESKIEIIYN